MAQRRLTLTFTALYVLVWRVWARLEVAMEDKVEVFMNSDANIPCIYNLDEPASSLKIQWFVRSHGSNNKVLIYFKDNSSEFELEGTGFTGRINVSHSLETTNGNSVLTISQTRLSDELEFLCQVSDETGSEERHTQLLVFNVPDRPSVEVAAYSSVGMMELEQIASCEVRNAYPAPNITWYKDRSPLYTSDNMVNVMSARTFNPSGLVSVKSILALRVEKEDKDAKFYCEVSYFVPGSQEMMESAPVSITLYYASTSVTMSQESPKGLVKEGDTVKIRCQGDGNPQPLISFILNEEEMKSENGLLVLDNVNRTNSGQYICSPLDQSSEEIVTVFNLTVHFLDSVVITPEEPVILNEGEDLSLTCNAMSSLPTHAMWYKDGAPLEEGHVLKLHNASYDMAGLYVCEVEASDLPGLQKDNSVFITVRGKPVITAEIVINPLDSEKSVNLSCAATGNPQPTIVWTLPEEQDALSEWTIKDGNNVFSYITISPTSDNMVASCEATNEMGRAEASRNVNISEFKKTVTTITSTTASTSTKAPVNPPKERVKREGSGVIIAVIIILILLLAILGSVLYFLYKKGKIPCGRSGKQDLTKEKASKDDIVVEMKSGKSEEAVLLQGVNGDKKIPNDQ